MRERLNWVAGELGVSTAEMLMVGDTATDMLAGRNAGVAGCVGIRDGAGDPALLARLADVVVGSIDSRYALSADHAYLSADNSKKFTSHWPTRWASGRPLSSERSASLTYSGGTWPSARAKICCIIGVENSG